MISDVNALFNVRDIPPREIYLENGSVVLSNSSGNLELLPTGKTETTGSVVLSDVLVVPCLKTNSISCSQLCRSGFKVQFDNETCQILEENSTKLTGTLHNKVYRVDANICRSREGSAYPAVSSAEMLWQRRLGHGKFRSIRELSRLGVARV